MRFAATLFDCPPFPVITYSACPSTERVAFFPNKAICSPLSVVLVRSFVFLSRVKDGRDPRSNILLHLLPKTKTSLLASLFLGHRETIASIYAMDADAEARRALAPHAGAREPARVASAHQQQQQVGKRKLCSNHSPPADDGREPAVAIRCEEVDVGATMAVERGRGLSRPQGGRVGG